MNKKADAKQTVIFVVIAVIASVFLILLVVQFAGPMSEVMSDSVCSFAVFFRQLVLGNPIAKVGQQLGSGLAIQPVDIPIPCRTTKTNLGSAEKPLNSTEFIRLLADQSKRCWALFGSGSWDSLIWSAKGQKFLCFDDEINVHFDSELDRTAVRRFMLTESVEEIGGTSRTYTQILPDETLDIWALSYGGFDGNPLCTSGATTGCVKVSGNKICKETKESCTVSVSGCDCIYRKYRVYIYFIDYISPATLQYVNLNSLHIDTVCHTYRRDELGGDFIQVCMQEITGD
ncbi:MAG: hypothetical protein PHW96_04420 [Candidatus Nanoarchaeia archaeon]|nr:hypothetical protein [Candidatus Nanoarchaeia archaeon]